MWSKATLAAVAVIPAALASSGMGYDGFSSLQKRTYEPHFPICPFSFTPFVYEGCFSSNSGKALRFNPKINDGAMTIEKCTSACKNNGFRYAGLEYYGRCVCGSTINGPEYVDNGSVGGCTFACNGNSDQICGGNKLVSVYTDPTYDPKTPEELETAGADYTAVGCFSEIAGRLLTDDQPDLVGSTMTVELCLDKCGKQGYAYAGVEYGQECYCAGKLPLLALPIPDAMCNLPCKGDSGQTCGGRSTIYVYYNEDLDTKEPCGEGNPSTTTTTTTSQTTTTSEEPEPTTTSQTTTTSEYEEPEPTTTSQTTTTSEYEEPEPTTTSTTTSETTTSETTTSETTTTAVYTTPPLTTPPTTTRTTTKTTTKTTTTSCRTRCGGYCAPPLPTFTDNPSCKKVAAKCWDQVKDCIEQAGGDSTTLCQKLAVGCAIYTKYCKVKCTKYKCHKRDCDEWDGYYPPPKPTYTPKPKPTYTPKPKPTPTKNLCVTPTAYKDPVGGVKAPVVSCNDLKSDYDNGNCWKVFSSYKSSECASFKRSDLADACVEACNIQYENCRVQYAGSCGKPKRGRKRDVSEALEKRTWGSSKWIWTWARGGSYDSYNSALDKCKKQRDACIKANNNLSSSSKYCKRYGYFER